MYQQKQTNKNKTQEENETEKYTKKTTRQEENKPKTKTDFRCRCVSAHIAYSHPYIDRKHLSHAC